MSEGTPEVVDTNGDEVNDADDAVAQAARWNQPPDTEPTEIKLDEDADDDEDAEEDDEAEDGDEEPADTEPSEYGGWTVAEMRSEIASRNAERGELDQIVPESKRHADMVAALEADDAEG